jgi:two-component system NtrC family sensor kinase
MIVDGETLQQESPLLAEQAYFEFIDTPLARPRQESEETAGMMLKAAAPIFDSQRNLIGTLYGGVLLNRNFEIVDKIKQTVYEDVKYEDQDIGTATIFQDDIRITTNVMDEDGSRATGTRVSKEVYDQVVLEGEPWIDRAYVVNNWYITAYEPIKDIYDRIIGILYVGVLEQKYLDIKRQTIMIFLLVTFAGALFSLAVAYMFTQKILIPPINKLVSASKEVAKGNLEAKVEINTNDELQYLADSFNAMAQSLLKRDEQLKEFTTQKIMESERLALIGQLAANVAHELNNPLQGIVAYSHLLLEKMPDQEPNKVMVEKIVGQANRSRDIIRGLLDFSRQRKPDKTLSNVNQLIEECVSLIENQAVFQNIHIDKDFQEDLPLLVIDPSQIERVFINIIINAAEAMDGTGLLRLVTRYNPQTEFVEAIFIDSGDGIDPQDIDKIFDPFFTTKDVGHGTGLGLAISYGIIKGHKGTISVESELGKGSTFTIRLPIKTTKKVAENGKKGEVTYY